MLKFLLPVLLMFTCFSGCSRNTQWEYQVITFDPKETSREGKGSAFQTTITPSSEYLDELGLNGWELVSNVLEMETAYPNFGNAQLVTGIQPNIRPQRMVMVFKRPFIKNRKVAVEQDGEPSTVEAVQ